jgi:predicted Zn finger-like uncharacterized protein
MIIACPACNTRYAVPDSAIGVDGRTVRCAKCRHSWFQDGPRIELPAAPPAPPPPPPPAPEPEAVEQVEHDLPEAPAQAEPEPVAEPEPETEPEPEAPAAFAEDDYAAPSAPPLSDEPLGEREDAPAYSDDDYSYGESSFAHEPPFRARRNPAKMWMLAAVLFAVVSLGALAAVMRYGLPDWVPFTRETFAEKQAGLELNFPKNWQERGKLKNGSYYYNLAGTITNVGSTRRSVPTLLLVFRGSRNQPVFTKEIVPPKSALAPGESMDINQAIVDLPPAAKYREIGWKPGT